MEILSTRNGLPTLLGQEDFPDLSYSQGDLNILRNYRDNPSSGYAQNRYNELIRKKNPNLFKPKPATPQQVREGALADFYGNTILGGPPGMGTLGSGGLSEQQQFNLKTFRKARPGVDFSRGDTAFGQTANINPMMPSILGGNFSY